MAKMIGRRLLMLIPVLLGVSIIIYSIMSLTPGDAATLMLGDAASAESVAKLRAELGLDGGFVERYVRWLTGVLTGDFGISYKSRNPVFMEVFQRFPNTVKLALTAIAISSIFGVLFGILSAVKQYTLIDNIVVAGTLLLSSVPDFWLGLMMILLFAVKLKWLPLSGTDHWYNFIMPGIAAASHYLANTIRMTRTSMLDVIRADYVRTARAKGCAERTVIFQHALRNALLPVVTLIGVNMGWQLGGTVITEQVFAIPGMGSLMIQSIRQKDTPVVLGALVFVALLSSLINLATDVLYAYIDPRIKSQYVKAK